MTNGLAQEMEFTFIAKGRTATSVPDIIGVSENMFISFLLALGKTLRFIKCKSSVRAIVR